MFESILDALNGQLKFGGKASICHAVPDRSGCSGQVWLFLYHPLKHL